MMSSPGTVRNELAVQVATITGIRRALPYLPNTVPDDLPLVCISVGKMATNYSANLQRRQFMLRLYLASIHESSAEELPALLDPFYGRFYEFFKGRLSFGLPYVQSITLIGDSGESVLTHAGETFFGTNFNLEVVTYVNPP